MASEALLEWTMTGLESATGHLNQVFEESLVAGNEKETELSIVSGFFKEFSVLEKRYKEGLVKLVLKYQKQVHQTLNDEKMMQYFQMLFNNLLVKSDKVEKRQEIFSAFQEKLSTLDSNFRKNVKSRMDQIQNEKDKFRKKLDSFRVNFGEYLRMCDSYNKYCVDKIELYQSNFERLSDFKQHLETANTYDQKMKVVSEIIGYKYDIGAKDAKKIKEKFYPKSKKEKMSRAELDRFETYFQALKAKSKALIESKMQSMKQMQKKVNEGTDFKIEEQSLKMEKKHRIVENLLFDLLKKFRKTLNDCGNFELAWKEKIKAQMLQFMCGYFLEKQDEILAKAEIAEKSFEPFTSRYAFVARDHLLPETNYLDLETHKTHFMEYNIFGHMRRHIENPTQSTILTKFFKKRKNVEEKSQLFIVMLVDAMFTSKNAFTPEIMRLIHDLMQDSSHRVFIQNAFLARKVFDKYANSGGLEKMTSDQVQNFAFFLRRIFEKQAERSKINDFLMYSLLRFASIVETPKKETLIQRLRDFPLVDQPTFWKQILLYMSKYIYRKLNKRKQSEENNRMVSGSNKLIQKLGGFFNRGLSPAKEKPVKPSHLKSFEDVSALLFRMGLGFEQIIDILLKLAASTGIKSSTVKNIMIRNKEVLQSQLELLNAVPLNRNQLESLRSMKTYDRVIRNAKGLTPRKSFHLKVISDPKINALKKCFEENGRDKISKLFDVFKWSLPYLIGKYSKSGWRKDLEPHSDSQNLNESLGHLLEQVVEEGENSEIGSYKVNNVDNLSKIKKNQKFENDYIPPSNIIQSSEIQKNSNSMDPKNNKRGSQISKQSGNILETVRNYNTEGIDEFLESATIISQRSKKPSPEKTPENEKKGQKPKKNKKLNLRDWKTNYNQENDPQIEVDLRILLEILMINRAMYLNRHSLIRKTLTRVWPLTQHQRKFLYSSLVEPHEYLKKPLLDYESYSFPPLASNNADSKNLKLNLTESSNSESGKRDFGESFMMSREEVEEHLTEFGIRSLDHRKTLGNDFAPDLKSEDIKRVSEELGLNDTMDDSFLKMVKKEQKEKKDTEGIPSLTHLDNELNESNKSNVSNTTTSSALTDKNKILENLENPIDSTQIKKTVKNMSKSKGNIKSLKDQKEILDRERSRSKSKNPFRRKNDLPTKKPKKLKKKAKKKKIKPLDKDHIIALDVKRTHAERADFDHLSLERILRNINHSEMGRFSYYQGLNYIVAYLLDLVENKETTYCLSMRLLESEFRQYVDETMQNLNQLFYIFRRILDIFLPKISRHIEKNENMQTSVIYANWFLTIFTTLKQQKREIHLLDQIFDVFISKGWAGFFRCLLVLLYYCEDQILSLRSEQLIVFLTDFARKGFEILGEKFIIKKKKKAHVGKRRATQQIEFDKQELAIIRAEKEIQDKEEKEMTQLQKEKREYDPVFDFKKEIQKFKAVNSLLIVEFRMEFHSINEAYEKKWVELTRKVEGN